MILKLGNMNMINTEDRISLLLICGFLATLPLDRFYSQLALGGLIVHTLIHLQKKKVQAYPWMTILLLSSFFLLNLAGMIWSPEKNDAVKDMLRQLAIVIFPLILYCSNLDLAKHREKMMHVFGISCCLVILYLFAHALFTIRVNNMPINSLFSSIFINHNFSEPVGLHATYLSIYASLSLAWYLLVFTGKEKKFLVLHAIAVCILLAGLVQLASRSVLIATFIYILSGLLFFVAKKRIKVSSGFLFFLLAALAALGFTRIGTFEQRLVRDLQKDLSTASTEPGYMEPRMERWKCAYALVLEAPFLGHGSGSEKKLLKEKYFQKQLFNSYLRELNAHNQYLSIWLKWGLAGLFVFLAVLALSARRALHAKNAMFFAFLVLISVVSFSENMLDVNKGIFFYAFFLSFFWLSGKPLDAFQRFEGRRTLT